jgi:hypothetical protein
MELTPFEFCARHKVRFATDKGSLALEQLFDLPLTSDTGKPNLNQIAKEIYGRINKDETNFVEVETSQATRTDTLMLEAVKRVIAIRQDENKAVANAREKNQRKQELLAALEASEGRALQSKSPDEIRKMLAEL